ncbi:MAG: hypothetical protein AB1454_14865 [Candidatus Auribacterota bacterium]
MKLRVLGILACLIVSAVYPMCSFAATYDLWVTGPTIERFDGDTGTSLGSVGSGSGIAYGPDGNVYVFSPYNGKVSRYNAQTGAYIDDFLSSFQGSHDMAFGPDGKLYTVNHFTSGVPNIFRYSVDGSYEALATMQYATGITFDSAGNMYVAAHTTSTINKYTKDGVFLQTIVSGSVADLMDIVVTPSGDLAASYYYSDTLKILDINTGAVKATQTVPSVWGLAIGPDGNLYVTNGDSDTILQLNSVSGAVLDSTFAYYSYGSGTTIPYNPTFIGFVSTEPVYAVPEPLTAVLLGMAVIRFGCVRKSTKK